MGECSSTTNRSNSNRERENKSSTKEINVENKNIKSPKKNTEEPVNKTILSKEINPLDIYEIINNIGEKSYGELFLVKHNITKKSCVMKEIKITAAFDEGIIKGKFGTLMQFDHPKVDKVLEFYTYNHMYYIISDQFKHGHLEQVMKAKKFLNENQSANIIYQVLNAMNYCHSNDVIHRDLKPENIIIEEVDNSEKYTVKVVDFGIVPSLEDEKLDKKTLGSINFMAPEIFKKNSYDKKCDMWSCGIILYYLITGVLPFYSDDDIKTIAKILKSPLVLNHKKFEKTSSLLKVFLKKLLERDVSKRLSALDALSHPWFEKFSLKDKNTIVESSKLGNFFSNLKTYKSNLKLQQICIALIVHNLPKSDEIKELEKAFTMMDIDLDGKLTKEELTTGFENMFKHKRDYNAEEEVKKIFKEIDTEKNGYITYEGFIRACIDKKNLIKDSNLKYAFDWFDTYNSGFIKSQEITKVLSGGDDKVITKEVEDIMKELKIETRGKVSFDDFKILISKIIT